MGEYQQPQPSNEKRTIRAAKARCISKFPEVIKIQNEEEIQFRLEEMQQRVSKRVMNENK